MVEFNIQTFLSEMREEQRDRDNALHQKLDDALATIGDHETRLALLEQYDADAFETIVDDHETRISFVEKYWTWFGRAAAALLSASLLTGLGWLVAKLG